MEVGEELDKIVAQVKEAVARFERDHSNAAFKTSKLELTLKAVVVRTGDAGFSIKIPWIDLVVGPKATLKNSQTQTVTLTLVPVKAPESLFKSQEVPDMLYSALLDIDSSIKNALATKPQFGLNEGAIELNFTVDRDGKIAVLVFDGEMDSQFANTLKLHIAPLTEDASLRAE
jgi:hypothetical protein